MATFEQLSPEQRAIVELVLRQGKTYGELSEMLNLPEGRVRELARDALVELAPVSVRGVEEDWRGQLADYVLGQQSGPEATATKGHLRRSEGARSWARSLLDSLEQLYENGSVPQIPDGERGRRAAAAAPRAPREPREPRSAMGGRLAPTADRRWLMAGAAALIVILLAVVIWPVGALTGGDDDDKSTAASSDSGSGGTQTTGGQSTTGQQSGQPAGIAIVVQRNGKKQLLVQAARLTPSGQSQGYYVWLYNSPSDAKSLGGQVTDQNGNYQAIGPLPADYKNYRFIDISRQQVTGNADVKHSGESVLRGKMPVLKKSAAQNGKTAAIGQTVLQPPA
jgi:Anti-sigma-K factor rskA/Sigma-70, region 4